MGMDSYLYKTTKKKHDAYMKALDKRAELCQKNADKITIAKKDLNDLLTRLESVYPGFSEHRDIRFLKKNASQDDLRTVEDLIDRINTLNGNSLFYGIDTDPGDQLAYWRKPYGLHLYMVEHFLRKASTEDPDLAPCLSDNMRRMSIPKEDLKKLIDYMKSVQKDLSKDKYFNGLEDFWDEGLHSKTIHMLEKAYKSYGEHDLIYYWAWF